MLHRNSPRLPNFEVLRVVSMLLIVVMHSYLDARIFASPQPLSLVGRMNYFVSMLLTPLTHVGVNCFVMITGYFLIGRTQTYFSKVQQCWGQTFFYLFVFSLLCYAAGWYGATAADVFNSVWVIRNDYYRFVTCYIGLLLVAPYLSMLAAGLSKRQYQVLLAVLALLSLNFVKPLQFPFGDIFSSDSGATLPWFIFLYFVAGYVRLYNPLSKQRSRVIGFLLSWGVLLVLLAFKVVESGALVYENIGSYNGILFFLSLFFFLLFKDLKLDGRVGRLTARVAPMMLGVFLLHEHPRFKYLIWDQLHPADYADSPLFFPYLALTVGVVMAAGIVVDYGRRALVDRLRLTALQSALNAWLKGRLEAIKSRGIL